MRVYISGKIGRDTPCAEVLEKFRMAELILKDAGHEVFNPTTSGLGHKAEELAATLSHECGHPVEWYDAILLLDLQEPAKCDAICLLPDWKDSNGATVELFYAIATKKEVLFIHNYQPE